MQFSSTGIPGADKVSFKGFEAPLKEFRDLSSAVIEQKAAQEAATAKAAAEEATRAREMAEANAKAQREANEARAKTMSEMSGDVPSISSSNMWDGDHAMLNRLANHLYENIGEYSKTPEGEVTFNALLNQLVAGVDEAESRFSITMGSDKDDPNMNTLRAAEKRNALGITTFEGTNIVTPLEDMYDRQNKLNTDPSYDMRIEGNRAVWVDDSGQEVDWQERMNDTTVFSPEYSAIQPLTGRQRIERLGGSLSSAEEVTSYMNKLMEDPAVQADVAQTYVDKLVSENPSSDLTKEEVMTDPILLEKAMTAYREDALSALSSDTESTEEPEPEATPEETQAEMQTQEQEQNQTPTETEVLAANVEREIGRELSEEEKESLNDPDVRAMLRTVSIGMFDDIDPLQIGMFDDIDPLQSRFRDSVAQKAFEKSMLDDQQRGLDEFRKDVNEYASGFDNVGDVLDSLDMGFMGGGPTEEGLNKVAKLTSQQGKPTYEDERTNDLMSVDVGIDAGLEPAQGGATATRSFSGEGRGMAQPVININPIDLNSRPEPLESIKYDHDAREFELQIGDNVVKININDDGNGNINYGSDTVRTEDGQEIELITLIDRAFEDIYGKGSLAILLKDMQRKASLASYGLD